MRPREYLTFEEVERLMEVAKSRLGRHGHRDATMILMAYRHGLHIGELVASPGYTLPYPNTEHEVRRLVPG